MIGEGDLARGVGGGKAFVSSRVNRTGIYFLRNTKIGKKKKKKKNRQKKQIEKKRLFPGEEGK